MAAKTNPKKSDIKKLEDESNERLVRLFDACDEAYFWGKMVKKVKIRWSKRMTDCAGTTLSAYKNQPVTVSLSRPILELRPLNDLLETLLHEMIHAFLWVEKVNEKEEHGPVFHEHMERIRKQAGVDLQVLHDFNEECGLLLKHVWRCNGPCRRTSQNRGYVRRAINREPSSNEKWFREHGLGCGGTFIKIKEPGETKTVFDHRLDEEIEDFIASTFPKYSKPMFRENIIPNNEMFVKRERRRRIGSQADEEFPKDTKNTKVKKAVTPKTTTPKKKTSKSRLSHGLKVKLNLTNRKATPYRFTSNDDICKSDSSDTSDSSCSDSPVVKEINKKMAKSKKDKTDEDFPVLRDINKKIAKSKKGQTDEDSPVVKDLNKKMTKSKKDKTDEDFPVVKDINKKKMAKSKKDQTDEDSPVPVTDQLYELFFPDSPVVKDLNKKMAKSKKNKTDEVSPLKIPKYIWQCDGKCKNESPKFGRVERCINKPPSQREKWFLKHTKDCGGNFIQI